MTAPIRLGFAMTGSFCTFSRVFSVLEEMMQTGRYEITPILSHNAAAMEPIQNFHILHLLRCFFPIQDADRLRNIRNCPELRERAGLFVSFPQNDRFFPLTGAHEILPIPAEREIAREEKAVRNRSDVLRVHRVFERKPVDSAAAVRAVRAIKKFPVWAYPDCRTAALLRLQLRACIHAPHAHGCK